MQVTCSLCKKSGHNRATCASVRSFFIKFIILCMCIGMYNFHASLYISVYVRFQINHPEKSVNPKSRAMNA